MRLQLGKVRKLLIYSTNQPDTCSCEIVCIGDALITIVEKENTYSLIRKDKTDFLIIVNINDEISTSFTGTGDDKSAFNKLYTILPQNIVKDIKHTFKDN